MNDRSIAAIEYLVAMLGIGALVLLAVAGIWAMIVYLDENRRG